MASIIGFITLFGIATRNGIMLVSHIQHLIRDEGVADFRTAVESGARERLIPILMTALSAGLALVPLALAGSHPGAELEALVCEAERIGRPRLVYRSADVDGRGETETVIGGVAFASRVLAVNLGPRASLATATRPRPEQGLQQGAQAPPVQVPHHAAVARHRDRARFLRDHDGDGVGLLLVLAFLAVATSASSF